jgi:hypothetical protein
MELVGTSVEDVAAGSTCCESLLQELMSDVVIRPIITTRLPLYCLFIIVKLI